MDLQFMAEAVAEARKGFAAGGIPIGSVLVSNGTVIGRGHNQRVQQGNPILHGEMDAIQNAGRLSSKVYARSTLYTTLSPCTMCAGTVILYGIPRVVIGENRTVAKTTYCEDWLRSHGVEVVNLDLQECVDLMAEFIRLYPDVWNEDIGREHIAG
ncbi:MAG: nucleoside deaminase [Caldilineaceae bacterium]|nr:nucleoside deaminase [Caldilineaceae bacterium]